MSEQDLTYCGLGLYHNLGTGQYFEKSASGELCEIRNKKTEAEQRYINKHLNEKKEAAKNG